MLGESTNDLYRIELNGVVRLSILLSIIASCDVGIIDQVHLEAIFKKIHCNSFWRWLFFPFDAGKKAIPKQCYRPTVAVLHSIVERQVDVVFKVKEKK